MDRDEANARDAFEQERRILLSGVAESLSSVVKQMARANENLNGLDSSCDEVEKVAGLWKAAYHRDANSSSSLDQSSSSLSPAKSTTTTTTTTRTSLLLFQED
ncbi:expressed unknown protein [Seminavis robusta]|uniref:Uncharacterized protein n=1 Tax=Seminavis robusta TaxID=568900 RepID=A0A9N8HAW1_9STRA|nr:expressed unknown protein [Seminavis robusta]|eukprot:Sro162_g072720.1 n/a (103) ;mRNA; f:12267-12673